MHLNERVNRKKSLQCTYLNIRRDLQYSDTACCSKGNPDDYLKNPLYEATLSPRNISGKRLRNILPLKNVVVY